MPTFSDLTADAETETGNPSVFLIHFEENPKGHTHISMAFGYYHHPCYEPTLNFVAHERLTQYAIVPHTVAYALGLAPRDFVDSSLNSRKHDLALMAWLVASPSDKPSKLVISLFLVVGKFSCYQLQGKRIIKWRLQRWRLYVIATVSDFCWLRASPHMSGCGMSDSKVIGRIRSQGTSRIFLIVCISHITN